MSKHTSGYAAERGKPSSGTRCTGNSRIARRNARNTFHHRLPAKAMAANAATSPATGWIQETMSETTLRPNSTSPASARGPTEQSVRGSLPFELASSFRMNLRFLRRCRSLASIDAMVVAERFSSAAASCASLAGIDRS